MFKMPKAKRQTTKQYLDLFFAEKEIPSVEWELKDRTGMTHWISNAVVIEAIKNTGKDEQKKIANTLRQLDFLHKDINHYLKHLAQALINA